MDNRLESLKTIIERNNSKFTEQKKLILEVLLDSDSHLDAKDIYDKLKASKIGIATIYRNLELFTDINIVKKINIDDKSYFEMKIFNKKPLHIHFKCEKCGQIYDIDSKWDLDYINLNYEIADFYNIDIYDADILLKGICNKCKNN